MKALAISVIALLLIACKPAEQQTEDPNVQYLSHRTSGITVHDIRLRDGTRCVVAHGNRKGGIACDWEGGYSER